MNGVHFGGVDQPLPDWRETPVVDEDDPDDEQVKTPDDVKAILGFDPAADADQ